MAHWYLNPYEAGPGVCREVASNMAERSITVKLLVLFQCDGRHSDSPLVALKERTQSTCNNNIFTYIYIVCLRLPSKAKNLERNLEGH